MAAISAAMVKELRLKTDAPMMECKKALTEADGDMAKAEEILRVKLGNKATKAASRITAEGVVVVYVSEDRKTGAILEVNSETDFVAKNPEFIQMAKDAVKLVAEKAPADLAALAALPLGEGIGEAYGGYGHGSAQSGEEGAADAYEPEVAFDIFKTFEFHTANVKRLLTCSPEFSGNPPDAVPRGLAAGVSFSCGHAH